MPQATNLTVNNGATTPISKTFTLITPAAGDGSIARWALKEGLMSTVFPRFTAMARSTKNASRVLQLKFHLPSTYDDAVTGLPNVGPGFEMNCTVSVPDELPESLKSDCVAFAINLISTNLVKEMMRDATPAT